MDTSNHSSMMSLFEQLGLPAKSDDIDSFLKSHSLRSDEQIEKATFWTNAQATFIEESLNEDSVWSDLVDQLDVQLRQ